MKAATLTKAILTCAVLTAVTFCFGSSARASFYVSCTMKAKVLKVMGPAQGHEIKARFHVSKIVRQGGYSSTWCNKYKKKTLTRMLSLPSKKKKLKKGQRIIIDYSYSHPRGSDGSEHWSVK